MSRVFADLGVTKLVDFIIWIPDQLSLHIYDFSVICYAFLKFTAKLCKTCSQTLKRKRKITTGPFAGLLRRRSSPGGVLLGRAYRGCNGEAREREEAEEHLPRSAFECRVNGIKLVGVNGGEDVRVTGVVGDGGLGVEERGAHEHHESVRKLLG